MKLLICTQAVDKNDPILGFFHRWIEEFAKHFEVIHVICLREGVHTLPKNVHIYSLGKENGESRIKYTSRFYGYLRKLRGTYTHVFIHMNPHYILLGGIYWKLRNTPIFFWRNHAKMNIMTRIAAPFTRRIFYTSPFACTSRYAHAVQMPVGIDHTFFVPKERTHSEKIKILFLGRFSPVKHAEVFVDAGKFLPLEYEMHMYGDAPKKDEKYYQMLKKRAGENIFFHPAVKNSETPEIYSAHDVYVNLTPKGSMDKTVLEAVSCEVPVIVVNESFQAVVESISFLETMTPEALAQKIMTLTHISFSKKAEMVQQARKIMIREHSLERLGQLLYNYMQ